MSKSDLPKKDFLPRPWKVELGEEFKEGAIVKGRIIDIEDFGACLEIMPGVEGLIRVPEVSWYEPINTRTYFKLNQEHQAKIIWINREDKRMYLSIKQLTPDPWDKITEKYPLNSHHTGLVKNITSFSIFIKLELGIGGVILLADLSQEKKYYHSTEFTQIGQSIEVVILNIDRVNRKLTLGYK